MSGKIVNIEDLRDFYAQKSVDDLDTDTLMQFAFDCIYDRLITISDEEFMEELKESAYSEIISEAVYDVDV